MTAKSKMRTFRIELARLVVPSSQDNMFEFVACSMLKVTPVVFNWLQMSWELVPVHVVFTPESVMYVILFFVSQSPISVITFIDIGFVILLAICLFLDDEDENQIGELAIDVPSVKL